MTNTITITLIALAIILSSSSADVQTLITLITINALRTLLQISGLTNAT